MPFDPSKPADHTPLVSAEMRGQLNGLKQLIDSGAITDVVVDAVNTVPAGQPASVTANISNGVLHLTFGIPQGNDGAQGPQGNNGNDGQQGPPGEVTNAQLTAALDAAIATTSNNTNAVPLVNIALSSGYDSSQVQMIADRLDALILALRRP
jgi:ankyrin repeat protein